jgi:hypothetical protein
MWTCPSCNQKFVYTNHPHSCNERTVKDFLNGKSEHTIELYHHFIDELSKLGDFKLHPARSRIAFAAEIRFGYIKTLGKNFVDVALTFNKPYHDNLCFYRIGEVPGGKYYQHYLRIYQKANVNEEVKKFMRMAIQFGYRGKI